MFSSTSYPLSEEVQRQLILRMILLVSLYLLLQTGMYVSSMFSLEVITPLHYHRRSLLVIQDYVGVRR